MGGWQPERCCSTSSLHLVAQAQLEGQELMYSMLFLPLYTESRGEQVVGVVQIVLQGNDGDFQPTCDILKEHLQAGSPTCLQLYRTAQPPSL